MHALGMLLVAMSGFSSATGDYEIMCGQKFSDERFISFVSSLSGRERLENSAPIERELENCPKDEVLVRLVLLASLKNRQCRKADDLLARFRGIKDSWSLSEQEAEEVAVCFYEAQEYADAVRIFSSMQSVASGKADLSTQYIYAESLYGEKKTDLAIELLRYLTRKDYASIPNKIDQIYYVSSLISLARMLYTKAEFADSIAVANKAWTIDPKNVYIAEIALASAAKSEDLSTFELRAIYCRAKSMRSFEVTDAPAGMEEDLEAIKVRVLGGNASEVDCGNSSPRNSTKH